MDFYCILLVFYTRYAPDTYIIAFVNVVLRKAMSTATQNSPCHLKLGTGTTTSSLLQWIISPWTTNAAERCVKKVKEIHTRFTHGHRAYCDKFITMYFLLVCRVPKSASVYTVDEKLADQHDSNDP